MQQLSRSFESLSLQAGWRTHTYPEVMFRAVSYSDKGHSCLPERPPATRELDFNRASNLYADAEEVRLALPCHSLRSLYRQVNHTWRLVPLADSHNSAYSQNEAQL